MKIYFNYMEQSPFTIGQIDMIVCNVNSTLCRDTTVVILEVYLKVAYVKKTGVCK